MKTSNIIALAFLFIALFGIVQAMALSIGSGLKLNLTINNTGTNYTNYSINNSTNINHTTTNPTNQTNNTSSQNNSNNKNNQTNANTTTETNNTNNNNNNQQENTTTTSPKKTKAKNNLIQASPASSTNIEQPTTQTQGNPDITSYSGSSSQETSKISKIILILPTMFLTDIFVITYTLYKTKHSSKQKKKKE